MGTKVSVEEYEDDYLEYESEGETISHQKIVSAH